MYSIGQFSKKTGVTVRALRYYDEKDLLIPSYISESGRRHYEDDDIITVQKITGLKSLGYSLQDIQLLMRQSHWGLTESLEWQKKQLLQKIVDINKNIELLDTALFLTQSNKEVDPEIFISLIQNSIHMKSQQQWLKVYLSNQTVDEIYMVSNGNNEQDHNQYIMKIVERLKAAYEQQVADQEVHNILKELFSTLPTKLFNQLLSEPKLLEIQLDDMLFSSPFNKQEYEWLSEKIEIILKEHTSL